MRIHEAHLARAKAAMSRERWPAAIRSYGAALSADPGNYAAHLQRSRARLFLGDWEGALSDREAAHAAQPKDAAIRRRLLELLLILGRGEPIRRVLAEAGVGPGTARFWEACLAFKRGDFAAAARGFAAADAAELPDFAELPGLFEAAARALAAESVSKARGLCIVGLGYRRLAQATLGGVRALAAAAAIVANAPLIDDDLLLFLGLFPGKLRLVRFRGSAREANAAAAVALLACGARPVVMVTRGHPLVFGPLAVALVRGAARRGVPCRVVGAVSGFEELAALTPRPAPGPLGLEVRGCFDLDGADPALPLVAYLPAEEAGLARVSRVLARRLKPDRICHVMPNSGSEEFSPRPIAAGRVAALSRSDRPCALYIPARGSNSHARA